MHNDRQTQKYEDFQWECRLMGPQNYSPNLWYDPSRSFHITFTYNEDLIHPPLYFQKVFRIEFESGFPLPHLNGNSSSYLSWSKSWHHPTALNKIFFCIEKLSRRQISRWRMSPHADIILLTTQQQIKEHSTLITIEENHVKSEKSYYYRIYLFVE